MQPTELLFCHQHAPPIGGAFVVPAPPLPLVPHALNRRSLMDALTLAAALVLALALLCSTVVCIVAICRAHRADVVAVLRALPGIVTALLRRKL